MLRLLIIPMSVLLLLLAGCATTGSQLDPAQVTYLQTAKRNFDKGLKALDDKLFEEAVSYFEHVRSKYPYSKYAALSDLKIADSYFAEENWLEAADAYDFFARFHPRHEMVPFAVFHVGKSYFKAVPSDFFLFPPSYVKDQTATKEAVEAINKYLAQFPRGEHRKEAKELKKKLLTKLAQHDMHVAEFYAKRKKLKGALSRFERVINLYPESADVPKALYEAASIAVKLGEKRKAQVFLVRLIKKHPNSKSAKQAKSLINDL